MKTDFPYPYRVRESARAKSLQLRISPQAGLEVVVPKRSRQPIDIERFLLEKRSWIEKHWSLIQKVSEEMPRLPLSFELRGIAEIWHIQYIEAPRWRCIELEGCQIRLEGQISDHERCFSYIKLWLKKKAERHFTIWLRLLSQSSGLPFGELTVRVQKTRWGSCTRTKNISLNYKLLFLDKYLVEHILLHELVHTRHFHHGVRFWGLLRKLDPNTDQHVQEMRRANDYIPSGF